ncbi:hypothetical protein SISSUDRAFT_1067762 [Sistotremastrum suecicum HHB10207 ss-3]|uniref:Uncharacterized protein n=1 Tax=Sistotremastrum suecicum HHB10207 ss-3 TaxID=1314776 RepID=A0A165WQQ7_9AGAM|nr:hypothetical protein SISSUDRAFT_1067762 [Sistotremastrum suecicum HHB10207 ss-3]
MPSYWLIVLYRIVRRYGNDWTTFLNLWLEADGREPLPYLHPSFSLRKILRRIRGYVIDRNANPKSGRRMTLDTITRWPSTQVMCREFFCEFDRLNLVFRAHRRRRARAHLNRVAPEIPFIEVTDLTSGTPRVAFVPARTAAEVEAAEETLSNAIRVMNLYNVTL